MKMTLEEAIETLRANYPDACYEQLREAVDFAIEVLKAQDAAGDTISRQAAIRWVKTECNPYGKPTIEFESGKRVVKHLEQMPSAQPEIAKTTDEQEGEWIPVYPIQGDDPGSYMCSKCKTGMWKIRPSSYHYCPNCGTKMKGAKDAAK